MSHSRAPPPTSTQQHQQQPPPPSIIPPISGDDESRFLHHFHDAETVDLYRSLMRIALKPSTVSLHKWNLERLSPKRQLPSRAIARIIRQYQSALSTCFRISPGATIDTCDSPLLSLKSMTTTKISNEHTKATTTATTATTATTQNRATKQQQQEQELTTTTTTPSSSLTLHHYHLQRWIIRFAILYLNVTNCDDSDDENESDVDDDGEIHRQKNEQNNDDNDDNDGDGDDDNYRPHSNQVQLDRLTDLLHELIGEETSSQNRRSNFHNFSADNQNQREKNPRIYYLGMNHTKLAALTYNNRALKYHDQERYLDAIQDYTSALHMDRSYALAAYNRAISHKALDLIDEALKDYTMCIDIDPLDTDAYNNRGSIYYNMGMYRLAYRDFSTAIELDAVSPYPYFNRSLCAKCYGWYLHALVDLRCADQLERVKSSYGRDVFQLLRRIKQRSEDNLFRKMPALDL